MVTAATLESVAVSVRFRCMQGPPIWVVLRGDCRYPGQRRCLGAVQVHLEIMHPVPFPAQRAQGKVRVSLFAYMHALHGTAQVPNGAPCEVTR